MSYPQKLHALVVEDEPEAVEAYKATFDLLQRDFACIDPVFVRSAAEAEAYLAGPNIFHVVILDLNLPELAREVPPEGAAPGERILERLAKRDAYPVPAVLVISGKLNQAQSLTAINARLNSAFAFGRVVVKGNQSLHDDIAAGLAAARCYCEVGVHVQDGGARWYPTLTPREEDLLRRCILTQEATLGVDIKWWSAQNGDSRLGEDAGTGATKVLIGRFLLDGGLGASRPTFFKFEPARNAPFVRRDAEILAHKLGHIKVIGGEVSDTRSLLVTQSVTSIAVPIALSDYLLRSPRNVLLSIETIVADVTGQLEALGGTRDDQVRVAELLWKHLDRDVLTRVCTLYGNRLTDSKAVLMLYDDLSICDRRIWVRARACIHGDLHAANIAIDDTDANTPRAFVFDAAGIKPDFDGRDVACLEVTTLLFNAVATDEEFMAACEFLYGDKFFPAVPDVNQPPLLQNAAAMTQFIRRQFESEEAQAAYCLMVFDAVLRQLCGLGWQASPNRVANPYHAYMVAHFVAKWVRANVPWLADVVSA